MAHTLNYSSVHSGNMFTRYISKIVEAKLPRRLKRLIYISSILGLIQQVKDPDMLLVEKLNSIFQIARYPDSFIFPMYIKSIIWKGLDTQHIRLSNKIIAISDVEACSLNTDDCTIIGKHFADNAPQWLKYSCNESMIADVLILIGQLQMFKSH